ncbi:hypothetical protein MAUB1S_01428 [Mycolicibacterium aubagnense]
MRVGGAREHVAGVPLVPGGVGQDVAAGLGGEEAVGHVDGDALLAFGAQAVGQGRQVGHPVVVGDGVQVVQGQAVGVVQQPADQGALAIVDRACCRDTKKLPSPHQKYPSRLRSSIAATDVRSSARVSPRSDTVAAEISSMTLAMSTAFDRTAPVMVRSPTVR